jgi:hypothetical protein
MCYSATDVPDGPNAGAGGLGGSDCGRSRDPAGLLSSGWQQPTGLAGIAQYGGAAPKPAARVRLELRTGGPAVVVDALDPGAGFPFRVYVGFAPADQVARVVALDAGGRELGRSLDLPKPEPVDDRPTDTPVLVATHTSATGTRKLYAYHTHRASCVRVVDVDGSEAAHDCWPPGASKDAIDWEVFGWRPALVAYGTLPRAARTVRITAVNGPPIRVRAFDGGPRFGRAYYLARIPCGRRGGRLTVTDARGHVLGSRAANQPPC